MDTTEILKNIAQRCGGAGHPEWGNDGPDLGHYKPHCGVDGAE